MWGIMFVCRQKQLLFLIKYFWYRNISMVKLALKAAKYRPLVVSFDAFGTLFSPRKPVIIQYNELALKYGLARDENEMEKMFPRVFKEMNHKYPNYGKESIDIKTPEVWWTNLIIEVFELEQRSNKNNTKQLCDEILEHFTTTKAYRLYDDVIDILGYMKEHNIRTIVSTNSDPRIESGLKNLGVTPFIDHIYTSYDLGTEKPDGVFFKTISGLEDEHFYHEHTGNQIHQPLLIHIGDERAKDAEAASDAGWVGIYVNRDNTSQQGDQVLKIEDGYLTGNTISTLRDLEPILAHIQKMQLL